MPTPFVWFDNIGSNRDETASFLGKAFGWSENNIGPMTFLTGDGELPFAAACDAMKDISGWVPYIEVDDLEAEVAKVSALGANVVAANLDGPAGTATFLTDPGGAPIALWKRGQNM